ncbi:hypothetical protein CANCADRAFT_22508 [Tortispora caseinolytica NRRL Y-17796]|uniref:Pseudouridine synthase n=1 Tax=Tortispora caseinolytica NRRL Y-17796 TaxID=767744 RepID=A0A1E4TM99_9ASCO|nr:hypothetical protein CANCADRAFT_22508 [Tortispora caseinolytica NRRL Y-17796]
MAAKSLDANGFKIKKKYQDAKDIIISSIEPQASGGSKTIAEEIASGANYELDGPLRRVPPYYFTYLTHCKERWRNRTLLDIFSKEFRDRSEEYYRSTIEAGRVTINHSPASIDTLVRNGDVISHRIHRHEPPITSRPIRIVSDDGELVVIDKPSGIPVHPTGRYYYNTVTEILKHDHGIVAHSCNRLDRLTSGLMFLARSAATARDMSSQLRERSVYKEYYARVYGRFPEGEINCDLPLFTLSPKLGLNRVSQSGKEATTLFYLCHYDESTNMSVVRCKPLTGRTHQIRVHLQYLGHPIANDPIYANRRVFGPHLGKNGEGNDEEIIAKLSAVGKTESALSLAYEEVLKHQITQKGEKLTGEVCPECGTELYSDPTVADLTLWLHAYKYGNSDGSWEYQTKVPEWALPGYVVS